MAVATATAITAGVGAGLGVYQTIQGNKNRRRAERALASYEREELDNAFQDLSISTLGADLLREENARTSANLTESARFSGTRGLIGAIPRIVSGTNMVNQEAAKLLDSQNINREYAIASDNARIEAIRENRDMQNIAAISSQIDAGRQDEFNGLMGIASSLGYAARGIQGNTGGEVTGTGGGANINTTTPNLRMTPNTTIQQPELPNMNNLIEGQSYSPRYINSFFNPFQFNF